MWIFHSFLILAKEYFRVLDSVSERLSNRRRRKKKKSGDVISCCSLVSLVFGNQKAAVLPVTIPGHAVSLPLCHGRCLNPAVSCFFFSAGN